MSAAGPPGAASNRWPWIAVTAGVVVVIAAAVAIFVLNRPNTATVNVEGTPTPQPAAAAASPSPSPPTLAPAVVSPSPPSPAPTPAASPTSEPSPSPLPPTPSPAPPPTPAPPTEVVPPPSPPAIAVSPAPIAQSPVALSPAPFTGEVSGPGGLGNTRQDIDAAYGAPTGQTAQNLVVFRKNNLEYHVGFVPDLNGRADPIGVVPQPTAQLPTLEQAQAQAHALLPRDAQPPNPTPEGNDQFVVERFTSQSLAQALPTAAPGGQLMIVYARDAASGAISRWVIGTGNDPNVLLNETS